MAEIPIAIATVYAAMGIYNGVKTCISVYQDAKRFKKYISDKRKHDSTTETEMDDLGLRYSEDLDTFYMIGEAEPTVTEKQNPFIEHPERKDTGKTVTLGFFTLL